MTSAVSLSKIMKQHLKEHTWLPVLSLIVQLLLGPVMVLLLEGNIVNNYMYNNNAMRDIVNAIGDTLRCEHVASQLLVMYVGVVLVAIFGFQYIFSIRMTDMVHSSPVKREKLFLGIYINGFLYWFIPNLISNLLVIFVTFTQVGGEKGIARLIYIVFVEEAYLVLGFLIAYNVILVAIMISGNIFNALVNTAALGVSVVCIVYTYILACSQCFATYVGYNTEALVKKVCVLSPLTMPGIIMSELTSDYRMTSPFKTEPFIVIGSVVLMVINFFLALFLYKNRKSELASRGTKAITYKVIVEVVVSITVGMLGALLMVEMTSNGGELPWGIFGAVVFSALCLGIFRIIFNMSFKEFLGRKGRMFLIALASVLVFLSFKLDWFGYDRYVAAPEEIAKAEIAFRNGGDECAHIQITGDGGFYWDYSELIFVGIEDPKVASSIMSSSRDDVYYNDAYYMMTLKLTLKNGREVYRGYAMSDEIVDIIRPVVESEEFIEKYYPGTTGQFAKIDYGYLQSHFVEYSGGQSTVMTKEATEVFMELYKEDFLDEYTTETMWDKVYTTSINVTYVNGASANYYIPSTFSRCMEYISLNYPELVFDIANGWNLSGFEPCKYDDDSNKEAYEYVMQYANNPVGLIEDDAIVYGYKDYSGFFDSSRTRFQYAGDIYAERADGFRYIEVFVDMTKIK